MTGIYLVICYNLMIKRTMYEIHIVGSHEARDTQRREARCRITTVT